MHIKEIILDGFKSYAEKTRIQGFDRHFNAITGLNGSGKSNIFDAICFVLGISSLSHVRVSNLNELINNKGNTGITKASVTIVFDNRDKKNSPVGCDEYNEITVTRTIFQGKSKFFLNGYASTQDQIKNLFQGIQMNIDNPHFLILQGKIAQVVRMKPIDLLGLLEEAAGTSSYKLKREQSLKLISKKEAKENEITNIIENDLKPQLEKFKKDRENYNLWKTKDNEINRLSKLLTAYIYFTESRELKIKQNDIEQYKSQRELTCIKEKEIDANIKKIEDEINKLMEKYENQRDSKINNLEKEVKENKNKINISNHSLSELNKKYASTEKEIENNIKNNDILKNKNEAMIKEKNDLKSNESIFQKEVEDNKQMLNEIERNYDDFVKGKGTGMLFDFDKQINDFQQKLKKTEVEKKTSNNQLNLYTNALNDYENKANILKKKLKEGGSFLEKYKAEENKLQNEIEELSKKKTDDKMIKAIESQIEMSENEIKKTDAMIRNSFQDDQRFLLNYRDPYQGFDRSKVKGLVCRLISVEDERYLKAIERLAGNRLMNIIVDDESTGASLLKSRSFNYHVTFIPNKNISFRKISADKLRIIDNISHDAKLALNVIKYDPAYKNAIEFVFGSTIICPTDEIAVRIAYDKSIAVRCVNLDGDSFDPMGTISGGSRPRREVSIIERGKRLNQLTDKISSEQKKIAELNSELMEMQKNNKLLKDKKEKLKSIQSNMEEYDKAKIESKIDEYNIQIDKNKEEINRINARIAELTDFEKDYNDNLEKLNKEKSEVDNSNNSAQKKTIFDKKQKEIKKKIKDGEKKLDHCREEITKKEYKINENKDEIREKEEQIESDKESLSGLKKDIEKLSKEISELNNKLASLDAELYQKKKELEKNESEIAELNNQKDSLSSQQDKYNSSIKSLDEKIIKYQKQISIFVRDIQEIEDNNQWIITESSLFNMKDSEYDFSDFNRKTQTERLEKLIEENNILKRKVNMKVQETGDMYEKQFNELNERRRIILKDKADIEKAIIELDSKRKETLEKVFQTVSESINKIYSTLLPGTKAKIEKVNQDDLMAGIEMRVAFHGQWKESLSELSGGQCSLLALSFILSLLLFKPAPIYIFDEIDAALDLSHTANLGHMLKDQFPQSQFIVVSLKDGMFNNANVLYKVSFSDGHSKVERITKSSS